MFILILFLPKTCGNHVICIDFYTKHPLQEHMRQEIITLPMKPWRIAYGPEILAMDEAIAGPGGRPTQNSAEFELPKNLHADY